MRVSWRATLPLLGALALAPRQATAQVAVTLHLGKPVVVTNYAPEAYGDWRTNYHSWHPVTLYYLDGQWYPRNVRGSRSVIVYRSGNSYFLPPREDGWNNKDRRYNYKRRPVDDDYNHAIVAPPRRGRRRP